MKTQRIIRSQFSCVACASNSATQGARTASRTTLSASVTLRAHCMIRRALIHLLPTRLERCAATAFASARITTRVHAALRMAGLDFPPRRASYLSTFPAHQVESSTIRDQPFRLGKLASDLFRDQGPITVSFPAQVSARPRRTRKDRKSNGRFLARSGITAMFEVADVCAPPRVVFFDGEHHGWTGEKREQGSSHKGRRERGGVCRRVCRGVDAFGARFDKLIPREPCGSTGACGVVGARGPIDDARAERSVGDEGDDCHGTLSRHCNAMGSPAPRGFFIW